MTLPKNFRLLVILTQQPWFVVYLAHHICKNLSHSANAATSSDLSQLYLEKALKF